MIEIFIGFYFATLWVGMIIILVQTSWINNDTKRLLCEHQEIAEFLKERIGQ